MQIMQESMRINRDCQLLRLPEDVLGDVFTMALPSIKAPPSARAGVRSCGPGQIHRLRAALNISHTCGRFREVAIGTSRLWNMLSPYIPSAFIPTLLERGKAAGYHIHLGLDRASLPRALKLTGAGTDANAGDREDELMMEFLRLTIPTCADWTGLRLQHDKVTIFLAALQVLPHQFHQPRFARLQFLSFWESTLVCEPSGFPRALQQITAGISGNRNSDHHASDIHTEYITYYYDEYLDYHDHGFSGELFRSVECPATQFHILLEGYSRFDALAILNIVILTYDYASLAGRPRHGPRLPFPRLRRLQLRPPSLTNEFDILSYACLDDMEMPLLEELLVDFAKPGTDPSPQITTKDAVMKLASMLQENRASFAKVQSFSLEIHKENDIESIGPLITLMPSLTRLRLRGYFPPLYYHSLTNTELAPSTTSSHSRRRRLPPKLQSLVYEPLDYKYVNAPYINALLSFLEDNYRQDEPFMLDVIKSFEPPKNVIPGAPDAYSNVRLNVFRYRERSPRMAWLDRYPLAEDPGRIV